MNDEKSDEVCRECKFFKFYSQINWMMMEMNALTPDEINELIEEDDCNGDS